MNEEKTSLIDVLVALRESILKAVEVINAYLQTQAPPAVKADELREAFPEDLRNLLDFNVEQGVCIIKPKQFLGSENFARVAAVAREKGGRYVSAGRDSRFEVPVVKQ